jgi:hypothetical protein
VAIQPGHRRWLTARGGRLTAKVIRASGPCTIARSGHAAEKALVSRTAARFRPPVRAPVETSGELSSSLGVDPANGISVAKTQKAPRASWLLG